MQRTDRPRTRCGLDAGGRPIPRVTVASIEAGALFSAAFVEEHMAVLRSELAKVVAERDALRTEMRPFPMQGGPPIPWFIAEAIYWTIYHGRPSTQTLERLGERGGFGWSEIEYMWTGRSSMNQPGRKHPYATQEMRDAAMARIRKVWPDA